MIQKYYIFVLTFLCLFCGQLSYGQDLNEGYVPQWVQDYIDAGGTVAIYETTEELINGRNGDDNMSNDIIDANEDGQYSLGEIASSLFGFEIIGVTSLAGETAYVLSNGDLFLLSGLLNEVVLSGIPPNANPLPTVPTGPEPPEPPDPKPDPCPSGDPCECYGIECEDPTPVPENTVKTWYLDYDGDGYHGSTYQAVDNPGDKWTTTTSGVDCDDARPQYTTVCCTTTCDSGYKLNIDTCECEVLPPCFGTTVEGLMPDGSGDQSQLVKALEAMVNSFFKSSDILNTMKTIGILDPEELSKGFDNYIKGGDILGQISIAFVANDYHNNPTTENFMKIFVEGALLLLPPPASIGYTALDTVYQKITNGESFADTLAIKMAEKSAELFDCDLGSGVYGLIH